MTHDAEQRTENLLALWPNAGCCVPGAKRSLYSGFIICHTMPRQIAETPLDIDDGDSMMAHWVINESQQARQALVQTLGGEELRPDYDPDWTPLLIAVLGKAPVPSTDA